MKKITFIFSILLLGLNSCNKINSSNQLTKVKNPEKTILQYPTDDISEIIKLADQKLYEKIYTRDKVSGPGDIKIEVVDGGIYHECGDFADCIPPDNICAIIITASTKAFSNNQFEDGTIVKLLPDYPIAQDFQNVNLEGSKLFIE